MRYVSFVAFRIYRRVWRYATAHDALAIAVAVGVSEVLAFLVIVATRPLGDFPARVFVVDALICTALVTASRLALRVLPELAGLSDRGERRRVVIVGAGRAGRSLVRELREDNSAKIVGFVDDNSALRGRRIQGVTVIGGTAEIGKVLEITQAGEVLVSIPNAHEERLAPVVQACADAAVPCRFVRRHTETMTGVVEAVPE
jgi:FlaA1/EpsC-like NDP-sugar epimerase